MSAKTINLEVNGTRYTLEYTRRTVDNMARQGFKLSGISETPTLSIPLLVHGAFLAHHRTLPNSTIDAIYAAIPDKEGFLGKLTEMYAEPVETLFAEPENDEGNAKWEANW